MKFQAILSSLILTPAATTKVVTEFQAFKKLLSERSSAPAVRTEPMAHNLKVWAPFFEELLSGSKPFEVRKNDRNYKIGDTLRLSEYNPTTKSHTSRVFFAKVTYILEGGRFGLEKGFVVMGLKPLLNELKSEEAEHYREMYEIEHKHVETLINVNKTLLNQVIALKAESLGLQAIDIMHINDTLGTDLPISLNKLN